MGNGLKSWVLSEEERGAAHEEGGEDIFMEARKTKPGSRFTRQMVGTVEELKHRFFYKSIGSRFLKL